MNRTGIEYLDYTCNPITGCSGDGCAVRKRCWALAMAKRLRGRYGYPKENPFEPTFHKDKLYHPLMVPKSSIIGLCFMGEFFDKLVLQSWRNRVYEMMEKVSWHTYFILTKQPQNCLDEFARSVALPNPPLKNFWLGVSVNTKSDLWRIETLRQTNAKVKAVSFEPLYEDLGEINLEGIGWVIIGAQTRPDVQPKPRWVWNVRVEASKHKIPIFLKNNLFGLDIEENPIQEFPEELSE